MAVEIDKQGFMQNLSDIYGISIGSPESIFYTKVFKEVMDMSNTPLDINTSRLEEDLEKANILLSEIGKKLVEISGNIVNADSKPYEYKSYLKHIGVDGHDSKSVSIRTLKLLADKYKDSEEVVEVVELMISAIEIRKIIFNFKRIKGRTIWGRIKLGIIMLTKHDRLFESTTLSYRTFRYVKPQKGKKFYSIEIKHEYFYFLALILKNLEFKKLYLEDENRLTGKILNKPHTSITGKDRLDIIQSILSIVIQDSVVRLPEHDNKLLDSEFGLEIMKMLREKVEDYSTKGTVRTHDDRRVLGEHLFSNCSAILSTIRANMLLDLRQREEIHGMRLINISTVNMTIEVDDTVTEQEVLSKYTKIYTESSPKGWFAPIFTIVNPEEREIPILDSI